MKCPPDKYRTLKISLKQIQKDDIDYKPLIDAVLRTHKLTILVYQFLRAYILYQYSKTDEIIIIDKSDICMVYKILMKPTKRGNKSKNKIDGSYLSHIIGYTCIDILTNIENNIKKKFFKYLNKFVNELFKETNNNILTKFKGKERVDKKNELTKELYELKQDLINNTILCNVKYHTNMILV